ncbi:Estrogen receptor beta-1 like [Quillaja saponaria]|uniref:Estrogen receptor beta-1 like n=1 Tax=Quillaja saponaria TaxID=32244 RepID=A0AAD7LPB7_QUISA|nr:Estrogen receptor beta-1 like [Quillaja saponaria]
MDNPIDHFSNMSTPTSPNIQENMYFYSVPTSPALSSYQTAPTSPRIYEDANSYLDDFEFETRHHSDLPTFDDIEKIQTIDTRYDQQTHQRQGSGSMPTMAFADELFCDGKVMQLVPPLKLPPRLQNGFDIKFSYQSSTASSPRSPTLLLKLPFSHQSFWNDDFDPFMVALENVKKETRTTKTHEKCSPFRVTTRPERPNKPLGLTDQPSSPVKPISEGRQNPMRLAEPKGLLFARQMRLVKMDNERPRNPNKISNHRPTVKAIDYAVRENKRQKIKKFLFRSASVRSTGQEDKL